MAKPPPPIASEEPRTVRVVVHPRKSVIHQVQVGTRQDDKGVEAPVMVNRTAMGGEIIEVSLADAAFLRSHGFLQEASVEDVPVSSGQSSTVWGDDAKDARPTINGDDGTVYRAGS